jgi:hypothetical protein
LIDIELEVLNAADQLNQGKTMDEFAIKGASYAGVVRMAEFIAGWSPMLMEEGK